MWEFYSLQDLNEKYCESYLICIKTCF